MASTSGSFISRTREIGEIVRQCFDDIPDVDICRIVVLPFTQQFPAEELEMIRAAFIVAFTDEELDWAMERVIRCVAFLTLDFLMPALRVCVRMEPRSKPVPAAPWLHPVVLAQPAPGCGGALDGPQAGGDWWLQNAETLVLASTPQPHFLVAKRFGKNRQTCSKVGKFVTAKALEIPSLLLEMAPGYSIWDRGLYDSSLDFCKTLRTNRHQPPRREAFLDLIEGTADQLVGMRRSQIQSSGDGVDFTDFRNLIMGHFISESSRCLLERLMNAPSRLQLQHSSRVGVEMEEVPSLPQGFEPERELVMKLLTTAVSGNVATFLDEAVERIDGQRALLQANSDGLKSEQIDADLDTETSVPTSHLPVDESSSICSISRGRNISRGSRDRSRSSSNSSRGSSSSIRSSSRGSISSSISINSVTSSSTCYPNTPLSQRSRESSCLAITPEPVATITMSSHEASAHVKPSAGEPAQRRRVFTLRWKSKRSVAPAAVEERPVAMERTRRPSLRSRITSAFSGLLCCCRAQE